MKILFGILIGTIIGVMVFGDNLERSIKVATMQVDTVYCTSLSKVEIDVDTVRTFRKDKLVVITGVKKHSVNYDVNKSEWMDSILLSKPNRVYLDSDYNCDWGVCTGRLFIEYNEFRIYQHASSRDNLFIQDYKGNWIIHVSPNWNKQISKQTYKNIETVVDRYWYILTH